MAIDDLQRTVLFVTVLALVLAGLTLWLADLRTTRAWGLRAGAALILATLLFVYHCVVAVSAERALFRAAGILGALLAATAAYRLSVTSERFFGETSWLADVRARQVAILILWLLLTGPILAAAG